ncbi:MAG: hypothetical protein MI861_18460 [Pirellulales bacterium]|nr:hypothetical protein [Pirellulales bacterium]
MSDDLSSAEPQQSPAAVDSCDSKPATRHNTKAATIACAAVMFLLVLAINWPYQYVVAKEGVTGKVDSTVDFRADARNTPVIGGWPFRYWISYSDPAGGDPDVHRFSALALVYNLILASLVIGIVLLYVHRRNRSVFTGKIGKRKVTIADLLAFTLMLAVPFGLWQRLEARHDQELELVSRINKSGGSNVFSAWVPGILENRLPASLIRNLRRIHAVRIEHPDESLVRDVTGLRDVAILRVGGGEYDLRLLDRLASNPHLHDIRISGRVIDGRTIQWIVSNRRLQTLNLMRTNVSAEALQLFPQDCNLRRLNLIHSDVKLSELGSPPWSQTIRQLILPHPEPNEAADVNIEGWPKLEKLAINELDTQANPTAMKVRLADLPQLSALELDVFQKFDLTLRNLPQLERITHQDHEWQSRLPRGGTIPAGIWCSRFDVEGLPEFDALEIHGRHPSRGTGIGRHRPLPDLRPGFEGR